MGAPAPSPTAGGATEPAPFPDPSYWPTPADTPPPSQRPSPGNTIPKELVGEWDGDGEGSARATKIEFFADGYVAVHYNNGQVLRGPAVVEGPSMTLYIPGGPLQVSEWSITPFDAGYGYKFENLLLDGVSYVRQVSGG